MNPPIPVFQLDALAAPAEKPAEVFFLGPISTAPHLPIDRPYRSDYYKIGICLGGCARLQVNLETYDLGPNSLMVLSPYVIKQWPFMSADCDALSIFFTRKFSSARPYHRPDCRYPVLCRPIRVRTVFRNITGVSPAGYRQRLLV